MTPRYCPVCGAQLWPRHYRPMSRMYRCGCGAWAPPVATLVVEPPPTEEDTAPIRALGEVERDAADVV